jgi:type VI secretion system secreted protein VgrG
MTDPVDDTENVQLLFECDDLPDVTWSVGDASFFEGVNQPFVLQMELRTDADGAEPGQLLGKSCALTMIRGPVARQVTGIVAEVEEGNTHPDRVWTDIVVVPAFEALRHRTNTRIFQGQTVPQILEDVIGPALEPYQRSVDNQLNRTYPECEYRTQYDESDLDFCHRLMEEEGIASWFDFSGDTETLVLADEASSYGAVSSLHGDVLLFSDHEPTVGGHEYVSELHLVSRLRPTKVVMRHFDWTHSSTPVEADSSSDEQERQYAPGSRVGPDREVYQHDERPVTFHQYDEGKGTYEEHDESDQVRLRRQAQAVDAAVAEGASTVLGMTVASTFSLVGHLRSDLDGTYLVLSVTHTFTGEGDDHDYRNRFRCIPANPETGSESSEADSERLEVVYRPERATPRPRVMSIQTATVVGEGGEEITTDMHGRVKVQFHWDREGSSDEGSSCFIRVQQPWAGNRWGFLFLPRHGMEVVVSFINGDPDRPLVLGSVYNAQNPPPYTLPDDKTKSAIKSNSSIGEGFNELRFEDKAGEEEIYAHAQKDYNEEILNCHTTDVGADQTNTVHRHQTQVVVKNQDEHVEGKQTMTVGGTRTVHVGGTFTETIDKGHDRDVSSSVNETITGGETRDVTGDVTETIGPFRLQTIDKDSKEMITGTLNQTVTGGALITSPQGYSINAQNISLTGVGSVTLNAGMTIRREAEVKLDLTGNVQMSVGISKVRIVGLKYDFCLGPDVGLYTTKLRSGLDKTDLYAVKLDFFTFEKKEDKAYEEVKKAVGANGVLVDFYRNKLTKKG